MATAKSIRSVVPRYTASCSTSTSTSPIFAVHVPHRIHSCPEAYGRHIPAPVKLGDTNHIFTSLITGHFILSPSNVPGGGACTWKMVTPPSTPQTRSAPNTITKPALQNQGKHAHSILLFSVNFYLTFQPYPPSRARP